MKSHTILIASSILCGALGCTPELGASPFFCNGGNPQCPAGYFCVGKNEAFPGKCVSDPSVSVDLDRPADQRTAASPDMGAADTSAATAPGPALPRLAISELMIDPKGGASAVKGEWFEVFNDSRETLQLNGWTIRFKDASHTIPASPEILIKSRSFLVLGYTDVPAENGRAPVAYAYGAQGDMVLSNVAGRIEIVNPDGRVVDHVSYSRESFAIQSGVSLSVRNPFAEKDDPNNWCAETVSWNNANSDRGTPGASPHCR